jgi:putative transcriptional regulator
MAKFKLNNLLNFYNLSQKDLSDGTGINKNTINRYCNNTFDKITKEHLDLIISFFQCSLDDIMEVKSNIEIQYPSVMIKNMIESFKVMEKLTTEDVSNIVTDFDNTYIDSFIEYQEKKQKEDEENYNHYLENKQEIDELSANYQIRFQAEQIFDELVDTFINKIIESLFSTVIMDDSFKKIFNNYKEYDYFTTNLKVKRFYRVLHPFLSMHSKDYNLLLLLDDIKNIYETNGLENLSDDRLEELQNNLNNYIENGIPVISIIKKD